MVKSDSLTVSAIFDTGDFIGSFAVNFNSNSYSSWDNCIQKQFNLSFDEFKLLELSVLTSVQETLKVLRPDFFIKDTHEIA